MRLSWHRDSSSVRHLSDNMVDTVGNTLLVGKNHVDSNATVVEGNQFESMDSMACFCTSKNSSPPFSLSPSSPPRCTDGCLASTAPAPPPARPRRARRRRRRRAPRPRSSPSSTTRSRRALRRHGLRTRPRGRRTRRRAPPSARARSGRSRSASTSASPPRRKRRRRDPPRRRWRATRTCTAGS